MDRPRLGSWGWLDIVVAVGELLLRNKNKKKGAETGFCWGGNNESDSFCDRVSFADSIAASNLISFLCTLHDPPLSAAPFPKKHHIKMKTSTFPGSVADCVLNHYHWWKGNTGKIRLKYLRAVRWTERKQTQIKKTCKITKLLSISNHPCVSNCSSNWSISTLDFFFQTA